MWNRTLRQMAALGMLIAISVSACSSGPSTTEGEPVFRPADPAQQLAPPAPEPDPTPERDADPDFVERWLDGIRRAG